MKRFYPFAVLLVFCNILLSTTLEAQTEECGFIATEADYLNFQNQLFVTFGEQEANQINKIPVKAWIIRRNDGTGGVTESTILAAFKDVNIHYKPTTLQFEICEFAYINNSDYYNFDRSTDEGKILSTNYTPKIINIYFTGDVISSSTSICGYAKFPGEKDLIVMNNDCVNNGSTLSHELGHYFGLFHTHEKFQGAELVDGSNCEIAGDFICDTPADPNISGKVSSNCTYTGSDKDSKGATYKPDPSNLMSYSVKSCRKKFSSLQISKIYSTYKVSRSYLQCSTNNQCSNIPVISCGQSINSTTSDGVNNFNASDYTCYEESSSFDGKDKTYKVTVGANSVLDIQLTNLSNDLDIFLLTDCKKGAPCVGKSLNSNLNDDRITYPNASGTYYIVVDGYNTSIQSSFKLSVNCTSGQTQKPNLRCEGSGSLSISGNSISITNFKVINDGSARAGASYIGYYLSTNTTITTSDIFLGEDYMTSLYPGEVSTESFGTTVSGVAPGTYYIGIIVDYKSEVSESNGNDNECYYNSPTVVISNNTGNGCACTNAYASTICDNFQNYYVGKIGPQSSCWTTWSGSEGGAEDGDVGQSSDGNKYLRIKGTSTDGGIQDVVFQLGNRNSGKYEYQFYLFAYSGEKAYYNILHRFAPSGSNNDEWAQNVYFYGNGNGELEVGGQRYSFRYTPSKWIPIYQQFDLNNNTTSLYIDGNRILTWQFTYTATSTGGTKQLAACNFYPLNTDYIFYIDNITFKQVVSFGTDGVESRSETQAPESITPIASADFKITPNPSNGQFQLSFDFDLLQQPLEIEITDIMGRIVQKHSLDRVPAGATTFDLTNEPAGIYYVRAKTNQTSMVKPIQISR